MIKYLFALVCVFLYTSLHSQHRISEIKGTLVYHGDYFIFCPGKTPKQLMKTSENDGIELIGVCVNNIFNYITAFKKYDLNINPKEAENIADRWKAVYMARVRMQINLDSIQTDTANPFIKLGFVYNGRNIKLTGSKLSYGAIILKSYGRNFDSKAIEKELEITPPDVIADC